MIKLVRMNSFTENMPLQLKQSSVFLPTVSDSFGWFELKFPTITCGYEFLYRKICLCLNQNREVFFSPQSQINLVGLSYNFQL